jgi:hypothetical protein
MIKENYLLNNNQNFFEKISYILIIISPIFSNYILFSFISYGDFFLFLALPWILSNFYLNYSRFFYLIVILNIILISFFILGDFNIYRGFYRSAYYFILFFLIINLKYINNKLFFNYYIKICGFASILLIAQWLIFITLGVKLSLQLPLPYYEKDVVLVLDHIYRTGGIFSEPSYFAIFLLPALLYSIRRNIYLYLLFFIAGIVSTSSLAFFSIFVSLIFYSINRVGFFCSILPVAIIAILLGSLVLSESFDGYIFVNKITEIFKDGGTLVGRFNPIFSILNTTETFFPNEFSYNYFITQDDWFNSGISQLVYFGWVGVFTIILASFRFGYFFSLCFIALLFTTHFMSSSYSSFIAISFLALGKIANK